MHQWEIHHEDVLLNMFMFSLEEDAHKWYHSLPLASISSLEQFHAAFNRHCQKFYSSEFICHNCCEEYEDNDQDMVVPNKSYEDEDHEEEGDSLSELVGLVKSLSAEIEELKADHYCFFFEENAKDVSVLGVDVLGIPSHDGEVKDRIAMEVAYSSPDAPVVSYLNEEMVMYAYEE
jgi:hypothetical protein